eukprot:c25659_g1_i4 orf=95-907(-)
MPEQEVASRLTPCEMRSQQLSEVKSTKPFMSKGGSVFGHLVNPPSQQVMINTKPLMLRAINGDMGDFAKALAASKSHSETERRRRERINTHLTTLRSLLPSSTKTDKASLLAEVVAHVKDLKRQAAEITEGGPVPTDVDELRVDPDPSGREGTLVITASLCCDDRPDLLPDLIRALQTLPLKTVRAEIATLGGRVKNVLVMTTRNDGTDQKEDSPSPICVQETLRAVLERPGCSDLSGGSSKRQRPSGEDASSCAQLQDKMCFKCPHLHS